MASLPESRIALEKVWQARLRTADERLKAARSHLKDIEKQRRDRMLVSSDGDFAYRQAIRSETAALLNYSRVLRITSDLVVRGVTPPESDWDG